VKIAEFRRFRRRLWRAGNSLEGSAAAKEKAAQWGGLIGSGKKAVR
jgi:hypothetical protein